MTKEKAAPEPTRLAAEDSAAGALLRRADEAFQRGLAEGPAWQRFQARNSTNYRALSGAAAFAALLACALHLRSRAPVNVDTLAVTAEQPTARPPVVEPELASVTSVRRIPPPAPSMIAPSLARALNRPVLSGDVDESTCRGFSSDGKLEQAVQCFRALSRRSDLKAQVALYEAARLSGERLHDASRALQLLDEHRQRFPESALRGEVEWLRVRSLERAGRLDEALSSSEGLLATPAGRPLASRLHFLRGQIYGDARGDCGHAVPEYVTLLGEPGPDGDEAELRRAQCLERLSRATEAQAAYEHYLQRAEPLQAALARARLQALSAAPPAEGQP